MGFIDPWPFLPRFMGSPKGLPISSSVISIGQRGEQTHTEAKKVKIKEPGLIPSFHDDSLRPIGNY